MNILTVDDHPLNLKLLRAQLEAEGHQVVEAANGLEALDVLEREPVDAIVSDILMPRMDGYRFCHEVRASPRFYKLPLIIYTATYTSPGDEKLALEVGADKYLKKPANVRVILESLEEVLKPASPRQFKPVTPPQELHLMKEYNERLVHKLEQKNWELQATLEELRANEDRLRTIVETEPECVKIVSREGGLLEMNPAGLAMLEAETLEDLKDRSLLDLIVPEHRAAFGRLHQAVMRGESGILEFEIIGLNGTRRWLDTHAAPLRDQQGRIISLLGITRDITERKRAEDTIKERERQLATLVGNLPGLAYRCRNDAGYTTEFVSEGIAELTGYPMSDFREHRLHLGELIHPEDRAQVRAEIDASLLKNEPFELTYRLFTASGAMKWIWERGQGIWDAAGQLRALEGFITDITQHKTSEQRLRQLNRTYAVLSGINELIVHEREPQAILEGACRLAVERGGFLLVWIARTDEPNGQWRLAAQRGAEADTLAFLERQLQDPAMGCALRARAVDTGMPAVCNDIPQDAPAGPWREAALQLGYRSAVSLPLTVAGRRVGTFNLHTGETGFFDAEELQLLSELAEDIAFALEVCQHEEERRQAETRLRESGQLLEKAQQVGHIGSWVSQPSATGELSWSAETARIFGFAPGDFDGKVSTFFQLVHPEDRVMVEASSRAALAGEGEYNLEHRILRRDGRVRWVHELADVERDASGEPVRMVGVVQDITERKQAEAELRSMNERYLRHEVALITLTRSDALLSGQGLAALQEIAEVTARTLEVGRVSIWRYERDRKDIVCVELYEQGEHRHSSGTILREEDYPAYFRTLASADVIAACDARHDSRTQEFSTSYLAPLNIGAMLDAPVHLQGVMAGVLCCEHLGSPRHWTADEQTFAVAAANLVSLMLAQAERKQMEEQLRQAQKMEAIGQLAGGIAHDFNNILGAILGNAELMKLESPVGPKAEQCLEAILSASHRAADLVQQILAFSRRRELKRQPMQLHLVVKEALKLLRASIPAAIEFRAKVGITPTVLADPSEIHQITMNLCTNAWHAFNNRPGIITVELMETEVDESFAHSHPDLHPGRYVCLSVADTGCGMDKSTLARIFEPFFTTKPSGIGTGLGLAVVHGIMKNHDGGIVVDSQPGAGTTFYLYFPVFEAEIVEAPTEPQPVPHGQDEHVLFVDDEEPLITLGQISLQRLGYRVTVAASADAALELFQAEPAQYDLVITDLNMPGMNGTDLGAEMLQIRPELRLILATGYSANLDQAAAHKLGFQDILPKPYGLRKLGELVHRVLHPKIEEEG